MQLITAGADALDEIMGFIADGKAYLKEQGLDQWQEPDYPGRRDIESDIAHGEGYLLVSDGAAVGYACLGLRGDASYAHIDGAWLNDRPYAVIHRLAMSRDHRGRGYGRQAFAALEQRAKELGFTDVRVDTHEGNRIMRSILAGSGYAFCGIVSFYGKVRRAYQKRLIEQGGNGMAMRRDDWYGKGYSFFANKECEYYPCHKWETEEEFNCLFCYCPLYLLGEKCGGHFRITERGVKDCTGCTIPHHRENYGYILEKFRAAREEMSKNGKP